MNQMSFLNRRPYRAAALLFFAAVVIFLVSGTAVTLMDLVPWSLYLIAFGLLAGYCTILLSLNGWWREVGFRAPYKRRMLWLFWLPFVPVLGNLMNGLHATDPAQITLFFGIALLAGFVEETLFRGLILRTLLPTGIWRAALISSLLFGAMHTLNVLVSPSLAAVLLQIGYGVAIGFCNAALVIHTGTIWPLILAHFLTNFIGFMAAGSTGAVGPVALREMIFAAVYIAGFSAYGVYLLRSHTLRLPKSDKA